MTQIIPVRAGRGSALAGEIALPPLGLFIDNAFVEPLGGGTFETVNPATDEKIADVARADATDVDRAVRAARRAFDSGVWPRNGSA